MFSETQGKIISDSILVSYLLRVGLYLNIRADEISKITKNAFGMYRMS